MNLEYFGLNDQRTHACTTTSGLRELSASLVPGALQLCDTYPNFATLARTLLLAVSPQE